MILSAYHRYLADSATAGEFPALGIALVLAPVAEVRLVELHRPERPHGSDTHISQILMSMNHAVFCDRRLSLQSLMLDTLVRLVRHR